jgi:CRISPR-associated protein Cas1
MNTPANRTARAIYPHRPDLWEPDFIYEELLVPDDHPTLPGLDLNNFIGQVFDLPNLATVDDDNGQTALPVEPRSLAQPIPARLLNEFVYCPRLFYYEFVDGVFVESGDTERGAAIHEKLDRGKGDLPPAKKAKRKRKSDEGGELWMPKTKESEVEEIGQQAAAEPEANDAGVTEAVQPSEEEPPVICNESTTDGDVVTDTIHSRSAMLSSERLSVVAKMDLIEVRIAARDEGMDMFAQREVHSVTPVDYKAGAPRPGRDSNDLWDTDKMQLGLQILILRDNGYSCDDGVIYYRATKQRVRLVMTTELEAWIVERITAARAVAERGSIPPPLDGSPKCVRCSLAPVCLPDETRMLARSIKGVMIPSSSVEAEPSRVTQANKTETIRRLMAARDDARALYLNTPGLRIGRKDELLVVKDGDRVLDEIRLSDVTHVGLFGNIQITTQTVQMLCELEIPLAYFSMGGWFFGITRGHGLKNVFTRIEQFRFASDPARCLALARRFVQGKIKNHRTMLMRLHVEAPPEAVQALKESAGRALTARSLQELLGMEGAAAAVYFQHFSGMIKVETDDDEIPGLESLEPKKEEVFNFDFTHRKRRPPTDPVNALLSLAYSLLAKDCTIAALAVGFDPYVGFFHQPRFGRPALALDLMEEFRPLIAESAVLTAINNRMINLGHFVRAGEAVNLSSAGRKVFFQAYEQRMNSLITHPVFDYKVSYRRVLELQARLLARYLTGEIAEYVPMVTR